MKSTTLSSLFLLVFVCCNFSAESGERSIEEIMTLLEGEKRELKDLKQRIHKQNLKISSTGKKEAKLLQTLHQMDNKLHLKHRELEINKWNIAINKKKIIKLSRNIKKTKKYLVNQKSTLGKWLRIIYKDGGLYPIKVLFSSENIMDMVQRMKYVEAVTEYDSSIFEKYTKKLENMSRDKKLLLVVKSDLMHLKNDAIKKKKEIENERTARIKFLKRLKKDKALYLEAKKEYRQRSKTLNELIKRLEKKLELGENLDFTDNKGRLKFPVSGKILNQFGKRKDRQYDVYIVQNGINIRAKKGTPVRAIYSGKVLYVGSLDGYGNLIIIGHGEKYHSIYGHMNKISTQVGKIVQKGQILGKSGDTGSIVGEALYFELRHGGKAIEPTAWFNSLNK